MVNKVFSIYSRGKEADTRNKQLIVEVGIDHIACMAKEEGGKPIEDFELFRTDGNEEVNFEQVFSQVLSGSALLEKTYTKTTVFINNETGFIAPSHGFDTGNSNDYLNLIFGNVFKDDDVRVDELNAAAGFATVYRVCSVISQTLHRKFEAPEIKHIYTKIIERLFRGDEVPGSLVKVQLYYSHFILVFMLGRKLQLIQTFHYTTSEDVVYYILDVCRRFDIGEDELSLEVSGIIDPKTALYDGLKKHFKNVLAEHEKGDEKPDPKTAKAYYFTPIFNLAE